MIVQTKDENEQRAFDLDLNADPESGPVSHGVAALSALLGGLRAPTPRPEG